MDCKSDDVTQPEVSISSVQTNIAYTAGTNSERRIHLAGPHTSSSSSLRMRCGLMSTKLYANS